MSANTHDVRSEATTPIKEGGTEMTTETTVRPFQPNIEPHEKPVESARREAILATPGFGQHFTDHMALADWTPDAGWHDERILPYGPLLMDPAAAVLHYGQEIFEGMKVYRHDDGSVWSFRPEQNAARFQRSAARLMLPELPINWFIDSVDALVSIDEAWVPGGGEKSLYVRPFMFGSEAFLGVRSALRATYAIIASPVGGYFDGDLKPVSLWLAEHHSRAASGGTGKAKCGGNYASSLLPLAEAADHGCDQVVFLDANEHQYVEELGGMNLFFVYEDGLLVTPASESILEGITKASLIDMATDLGHEVSERPFTIQEWKDGAASGRITEVFACGTAAVISPVGRLAWKDGEINTSPNGKAGPITQTLRRALVDLQYGRAEDTRGWMHQITNTTRRAVD